MAGKIEIKIIVNIRKTGQSIKIGMTKGNTIGELKAKIQDMVGIAKDQLLLQFPGGNPTDGLDYVHLWQNSTLENAEGWRLLNEVEEVQPPPRVMIEDATHGMPPQQTTGFNLGVDKLTKDNLKEFGRLMGMPKFNDKDLKGLMANLVHEHLEWAFSKDI